MNDNRETARRHLTDLIERLQSMDVRTIEEADLLNKAEDALRRFLESTPYIIADNRGTRA